MKWVLERRPDVPRPPRRPAAAQELAFVGFVLLGYLLTLQAVSNLAAWGYRWAILNLMPSLWMLCATLCWTRRFAGASDYFHAGSKAGRRSGVAIIILSLLFCLFVEVIVSSTISYGDTARRYRTVVNLVILVPFAEEFFFRGLALDHLARCLGRGAGVALVSVLFALMHAPQGVFIQMFILSALLCLVTLKTRNVLVSATIHLGWNLMVFYHQFANYISEMAARF